MLCYRSLIYDAASADSLATDSTGEPHGCAQPSEARQSKMQVSDCMDAALTRARQARLPSPWTEAVDFLCFPQKPCTPMLNFFARSGPEIEKIDSLWTGRGQARLARAGEGSSHI